MARDDTQVKVGTFMPVLRSVKRVPASLSCSLQQILALSIVLLLTACGGSSANNAGGGNPPSPTPAPTPGPSTAGEWTWISGSSISPIIVTALPSTRVPAGRSFAVSWTDRGGNFWLYGGVQASGPQGIGAVGFEPVFNDLWKFNPTNDTWTLINGTVTGDPSPVYGTQGVASTSNTPGPRENAVSWSDSSGSLWLLGGGYGSELTNDLWKFSPTANTWTWVSGSGNPGGDPSDVSIPDARMNAVSWTDGSDNLWLFGGEGQDDYGYQHNDLWKFNPSANSWKLVSGRGPVSGPQFTFPIYGTQGVASARNNPGGRENAVSWIDSSGNLWLFGGDSQRGTENDLWKFSPTANTWTWVSGSNTYNAPGAYGTQGTASASNIPAGGYGAGVSWTDSGGDLWLFGGQGLNALWKFSPAANTWTWVSGSNTVGALGLYGTQGTASASNVPGSRFGGVSWIDGSGNLWLAGGDGMDSVGPSTNLNDLWRYQPK
jgi:N-acetylneuraminic acid mutarotase